MNYKKIKMTSIIRFLFKNLFHERSFVIFFVMINLFSIVISIFFSIIKTGYVRNELFDFYVIIYLNILTFLFIIRILMFFFVKKQEDKTIFIILSNSISRSKYLITQYITISLLLFSTIIFSYASFNIINIIINGIETFTIRKTLYFFIFSVFIVYSLVNLIIFLILFLGTQPTLIITSLLMSMGFIANIPNKLYDKNNDNLSLNIILPNSIEPFSIRTNEMDDTFNFEKLLNEENIKYKYLSKAINSFLTNFDDDDVLKMYLNMNGVSDKGKEAYLYRYNNFWDSIGVINKGDDAHKYNLKGILANNNQSSGTKGKKWSSFSENNKPDNVEISFKLDSYFIGLSDIKDKVDTGDISEDNKLILNDLYNFTNDLISQIPNIYKEKNSYFGDFIYFDKNYKNTIFNTEKNDSLNFTEVDLINIFKSAVAKIGIAKKDEGLTLYDNGSISNFFNENFNFPLLFSTRVLEQYFLNYTTKYYYLTNYPIIQDDNFTIYIKNKQINSITSIINPFFSTWSYYTLNSGMYFNDIWFDINSDSNIKMYEQENFFLPYTLFNYDLIDDKINKLSYNNYIDPVYFNGSLIIFTSLLFLISLYKFKKSDIG
ncbi:hypothetical protein SCORR_v1c05560 [Spiroplasma corruscae]|uniref:Uncharacterized protein n=2 Tax=Spiroplasma corruscae TaxID=216934 RepID=A0A222EP85_9MOLU|nr:hypothetical protein SCORR_v1c05560 [Spiroplasma corruscae]